MSLTSIEEQLAKDGFVLELSVGISMRPMLRQRTEQLVIRRLDGEVEKNDVVLFKRPSGQYVLHRVVGINGDTLTIRGDNCLSGESVPRSAVIGRLDGFYRKDKYVDCAKSRGYLCYVAVWNAAYPIRGLFLRSRAMLGRAIKKLRRWKND